MAQENSEFSLKSISHEETGQTLPLTVNAPVIIDAETEEGIKPLLDFVHSLASHDNTAAAEQESSRLTSYFSSMSLYLTRALATIDPESGLGKKEDALKKLTAPGGLSGIFNAMAACTRNTLLSDVAIMPQGVRNNKMSSSLFGAEKEFKASYDYCGHKFHFGFLQVRSVPTGGMKECSTAFPTLMVSSQMMAAIQPHRPEALLRDLQAVLTFINHDILHHFTAPMINSKVVPKFDLPSKTPIDEWGSDNFWSGYLYEEWAHIGQERILLTPENAAQVEGISKTLDRYFDELKRIGETIMDENSATPATEKKQKAHETVDFFGMMMAHALTRLFPLNHPVMTQCLNRLQQTDPDPETACGECAKTMEAGRHDRGNPPPSRDIALGIIRKSVADLGREVSDIIQSYKSLGCDILPDQDSDVGYKSIKLLQLIKLFDKEIHPHTPGASHGSISMIQKTADHLMLTMVEAAAKTAGYKPK